MEQVDLPVLIARSRVDVGDDAVGGQLNTLEDGGGKVLRHGLKALALAVLADEDLLQGVCHADGLGEILDEVVGVSGGVELGLFPAGFQSVLVYPNGEDSRTYQAQQKDQDREYYFPFEAFGVPEVHDAVTSCGVG